MKELESMVAFARVVETKSFSAAAIRLGLSKSLVSKLITKLEKSLGARLLNRTTRNMSVTEAGAILYAHCARIIEEMEQAKLAVNRLQEQPRGVLKISASVAFGTLHIAPALPEFLASFPEVTIDMIITDRFVDLADEGYDLAVRITENPGQNLVARRLATVRRAMCATPDYFARRGIPQTPADLVGHNCLTYTHANPQGRWDFLGPDGEISVASSGSLRLNDDQALSQAVLGGLGVAILPTFIIGNEIRAGRLQSVLSEFTLLVERQIYAVYLPNRHLSAKVRTFIDFLLQRFGPEPSWDRF